MRFHINTGTNNRKKKNGGEFPFSFIVKLITVAVILFLLLVYRVSLNQQAQKMNRGKAGMEREIEKLEREISHLKMKEEKLSSWKFIARRVREHRLNLRIPKPHQVKSLLGTKNNFYRSKSTKKKKFEVSHS